jgi:hypothetical protein
MYLGFLESPFQTLHQGKVNDANGVRRPRPRWNTISSHTRRISQDSVTYVADLRSDWNWKSKWENLEGFWAGVSLLLHDIEPFDFSVQGAG